MTSRERGTRWWGEALVGALLGVGLLPGCSWVIGDFQSPTGRLCADHDDCPICQKCTDGGCILQDANEDIKDDCGTSDCWTGQCDGAGACGFFAEGEQLCPVCFTCTGTESGRCVALADYRPDAEGVARCEDECHQCVSGICQDFSSLHCRDIVLYLDFEDRFTGHDGTFPVATGGSEEVSFGAGAIGRAAYLGKYWMAFEMTGPAPLPTATVALWVKPDDWVVPDISDHVFWYHGEVGPFSAQDAKNNWLGIGSNPTWTCAVVEPADVQNDWVRDGWNHLAATWNAIRQPAMTFMLNGDPRTGYPTWQQTDQEWVPPVTSWWRIGGFQDAWLESWVDECVVWGRVLSRGELKCLYDRQSQGQSIADLCGWE